MTMKIENTTLGTRFEYEDGLQWAEITVRNVESLNPSEALQISVNTCRIGGKRTTYVSFSLPKEAIPAFIEAASKEQVRS